MRMWADTEFNEYHGQTISIGIVADDGTEFYEVLSMREQATPWVEMNVMGRLHRPAIEYTDLQARLFNWLNRFESIQMFVDHPADAHRFLRLLETDEQGGWAEVPRLLIAIVTGLPGKQSQYSLDEHNALSDARALRVRCQEKRNG